MQSSTGASPSLPTFNDPSTPAKTVAAPLAVANDDLKQHGNGGDGSNLTLRQSLLPVALVTILFFMWGFAYGLLDVLNKHFQHTLNITRTKSSGLQGAYFGAYFVAPLTFSGYVLRRWGYKVTFMTGLSIYGVGAILYWPSGVYRSFPGFCAATFVIGCGLSTLETAANPYISICGPPRYSEIRLNTSQAFQAVGTVVAPLLAAQVFFKHVGDQNLQSVQYVYLAIAIFVFLLAVAFYFAPIPEISDADMQSQVEETGLVEDNDRPIYKELNLLFGTAAQFCYVGAQVAVASYFINYATEAKPGLSDSQASNYLSVAQSCFAVGRFSAAFLMKLGVKPRYILLFYLAMTVVFSACAQTQTGAIGIAMVCLILFFESCIFPTIFTLALRGLGRHTKRGASFLVASISGGAVFPAILGATADNHNSTPYAFCVPMAGFIFATCYPIYLNIFERQRLDGFINSTIGTEDHPNTKPHRGSEERQGDAVAVRMDGTA
ncbi:hypothetical protein L7F22_062902 [Adiantum nelumboides]|nr:hypothetical protein [Adiantum nelumboides]